jgi:hypothetical protein
MHNQEIAASLEGVARLLELQDANPFRVRSYRRAAEQIRQLEQPLAEIYQRGGQSSLRDLEGVGKKLAGSLAELIETGRLSLLDRLQSEVDPQSLFAQVPGIGKELADRVHDELGISTLEELELAAHDGSLARVEGFGGKRLSGVQDALAGMLSMSNQRRAQRIESSVPADQPDVGLLLQLDQEYREQAAADMLPRVAPKRFNPTGETWLPIMKTHRGGWDFTLLYSNTKRAHELGKVRDWVVVYYEKDHEQDQCTIVTAAAGKLKGRRVVRGREQQCRQYYQL